MALLAHLMLLLLGTVDVTASAADYPASDEVSNMLQLGSYVVKDHVKSAHHGEVPDLNFEARGSRKPGLNVLVVVFDAVVAGLCTFLLVSLFCFHGCPAAKNFLHAKLWKEESMVADAAVPCSSTTTFSLPLLASVQSPQTAVSYELTLPGTPCGEPIRAVLSRPTANHAWTTLELALELASNLGMPPLLTCCRTDIAERLENSGSTGSTWGSDVPTWLHVQDAGGRVVASIASHGSDRHMFVRKGPLRWEIKEQSAGDQLRILVLHEGQEKGQATSQGPEGKSGVTLTLAEPVHPPDSALLIMCLLACLVFRG